MHLVAQEEKENTTHSDPVNKTALEEEQEQSTKEEKGKKDIEETQLKPKRPFPQRLLTTKKEQLNADIYEVFKQESASHY